MTGLALTLLLAVGLVAAIALYAVRRPRRYVGVPAAVAELLASARRRAIVAVACAAAVFLVLFVTGTAVPALLGLPIVVAGGTAGASALLLYAVTPPQWVGVAPDAPRVASLAPRDATSFLSRPAVITTLGLALLQVGLVVFTGITARPDEEGLYRTIGFETATGSSAASPYAGWFYTLPMLCSSALLIASLVFALRRVASTPALPSGALAAVDAAWRAATARILATIGIAALALPTGGAALVSGLAMRNAADGIAEAWVAAGTVLQLGGVLLLLASVAAIAAAAMRSATLPVQVRTTYLGARAATTSSEPAQP